METIMINDQAWPRAAYIYKHGYSDVVPVGTPARACI
jgi:hypothetical protein